VYLGKIRGIWANAHAKILSHIAQHIRVVILIVNGANLLLVRLVEDVKLDTGLFLALLEQLA
jgi:hypothetical protein